MPRPKKLPLKERLLVHSLIHTPTTQRIVTRLSQEATDYIGRQISQSAILRALITKADQEDETWVRSQLFPLVEKEIASGLLWGSKKK